MKFFKTNNTAIIRSCQKHFCFKLPSNLLHILWYLQEYLPKTRLGEGLGWLSGGSQLYESCLRWYLSTTSGDVTASTLHRLGRDAVSNVLSRIDRVYSTSIRWRC